MHGLGCEDRCRCGLAKKLKCLQPCGLHFGPARLAQTAPGGAAWAKVPANKRLAASVSRPAKALSRAGPRRNERRGRLRRLRHSARWSRRADGHRHKRRRARRRPPCPMSLSFAPFATEAPFYPSLHRQAGAEYPLTAHYGALLCVGVGEARSTTTAACAATIVIPFSGKARGRNLPKRCAFCK